MDIQSLYLPMVRQDLEKHIQWQVSSKNYRMRNIYMMKKMVLFQEQLIIYGDLLLKEMKNTPLKPHFAKFIMNRLRICLIPLLVCFIVDGIVLMDSLLKI
jgi:hypothetical protein